MNRRFVGDNTDGPSRMETAQRHARDIGEWVGFNLVKLALLLAILVGIVAFVKGGK